MVTSVEKWLGASTKVAKGAFVDSCHRHCGCSDGITADADGTNPKQAFAKWYASLWAEDSSSQAAVSAPMSLAKTQLWAQAQSYPCTDCCASAVAPGVDFVADNRIGCGGASDDSGCSYNGVAQPDGSCLCAPQWKGKQCATFNFIPTARDAGYQPTTLPNGLKTNGVKEVSTWGGPVVRSQKDGLYHMYASTFVNGYNVWEWSTFVNGCNVWEWTT